MSLNLSLRSNGYKQLILPFSWENFQKRTQPRRRHFPLFIQPPVNRTLFPVTFGELVKVDIEALHDGACDEAKSWTDGGRSEEEAWKTTGKGHEQSHQEWLSSITILFTQVHALMLTHAATVSVQHFYSKIMKTIIASIILQPFLKYNLMRSWRLYRDKEVSSSCWHDRQCRRCQKAGWERHQFLAGAAPAAAEGTLGAGRGCPAGCRSDW